MIKRKEAFIINTITAEEKITIKERKGKLMRGFTKKGLSVLLTAAIAISMIIPGGLIASAASNINKFELSNSDSQSTYGQSVTFSTKIEPANATGTVKFYDGGTLIGSVVIIQNAGKAEITISTLTAGDHDIRADYSGDGNYHSTSDTINQDVYKATASMSITSSFNPSIVGQSVTYTASLPADATGHIAFYIHDSHWQWDQIGNDVTINAGSATSLAISSLTAGSHTIVACYSGNGNYNDIDDDDNYPIVTQNVLTSTTLSVSGNPNRSNYNSPVIFTATVLPSDATGTVTFSEGTTTLGTGSVASGKATLTISTLAQGTHTIKAVYGGNSKYGSSTATTTQVVNTSPTATNGSLQTAEDTAKAGTLSGTDIDGTIASYAITVNPAHGNVTGLNTATGAYTYTPSLNYNGSDSFSFTVTDNNGSTSSNAIISITVTSVNDAPTATSSSISTNEDTAVNGILSGNDVDGTIASYAVVSNPVHGTISGFVSFTGNYTYTPAADYNGSDSFTFSVKDNNNANSVLNGLVSITIAAVNDAPIAVNSTLNTDEDTAKAGTLSGTDIDGTIASFAIIGNPSNGAISGFNSTTGAYTYTPNANYNGTDSFTFTVTDNSGAVSVKNGLVSITINSVNDAPTTDDNSISTNEDTAVSGNLTGKDVDGTIASFALIGNPSHGVISGFNSTTGVYTYTPNANYNGTDSFTFTVTDNNGAVSVKNGLLSITINSVNDAPTATNGTLTTNEDTAVSGTLAGSDIDGTIALFALIGNPSHGVISGFNTTTGVYTYTPNANYNGTDSFTFAVTDNNGAVSVINGLVNITINSVNDAPIATNGTLTTNEDTAVSGTLAGSDVDGTIVSFAIVANPSHGVISGFNSNTGAYTYTPNANYYGVDSFTFKVSDNNQANSALAGTISITVDSVNDAPTATASTLTTNQDTAKSGALAGIDIDGTVTQFRIGTNPSHGTVVLNAQTGAFTYTPENGYFGPDSFTFSIMDNNEAVSTTAIVTITVNEVIKDYSVLYVDQATGKTIASDIGSGTLDKTVTRSPITITDYTAVSNSSKSLVINADVTKNVITFYYTQNVVIIDDSTPAASAPATPAAITIPDNNTPAAANPHTGDNASALPIVAALFSIMSLLTLSIRKVAYRIRKNTK